MICLKFPIDSCNQINDSDLKNTLSEALNINQDKILYIGRNSCDVLIELQPLSLPSLDVDLSLLSSVECRGVIVTCEATDEANAPKGCDFVSRFFAPRAGRR